MFKSYLGSSSHLPLHLSCLRLIYTFGSICLSLDFENFYPVLKNCFVPFFPGLDYNSPVLPILPGFYICVGFYTFCCPVFLHTQLSCLLPIQFSC